MLEPQDLHLILQVLSGRIQEAWKPVWLSPRERKSYEKLKQLRDKLIKML